MRRTKLVRTARPVPPGRSLDLASDGEARGMVVTPKPAQAGGGEQNSAYGFAAIFFTFVFSTFAF
jgi:hypothetical protein